MPKDKPEIRFAGYTDAWEKRRLGEYANYRRGSFPQPYGNKEWYGGKDSMPFVQVVDVTNKLTLVDDTKQKISKLAQSKSVFVPKGKVVITLQGSIGRVAITQYDSYVDRTLLIFENYVKPTNEYFWAYTLQQKFEIEKRRAPGGTIKTITKEALSIFEVHLPEYKEQVKIGTLFQYLDTLITVNQRKVDLLKELKKGFLQKMFPKNEENYPQIRFAGYTDAWEKRKLSDNIIQYNEHTIENNQYPVFTSSRKGLFFQKDYYDGHQIASVDNTGYNIVPKGYFTYRHMSDDLIFKFNINDLADYGIVSTLYPVFTTTENLDAMYLMYQLNEGTEFKRFSLLQKQGGSRTYMYFSKLKELKLTIPNIKEQKSISELFKQLDSLITVNQRRVDLLKQEKKALLQKMFV